LRTCCATREEEEEGRKRKKRERESLNLFFGFFEQQQTTTTPPLPFAFFLFFALCFYVIFTLSLSRESVSRAKKSSSHDFFVRFVKREDEFLIFRVFPQKRKKGHD
jgi:hypothetical protein